MSVYREPPRTPSLLDDLQTALQATTPETLAELRVECGIGATAVEAPHTVHVAAIVLYVAMHPRHLQPLLDALSRRNIPRPPADRPR